MPMRTPHRQGSSRDPAGADRLPDPLRSARRDGEESPNAEADNVSRGAGAAGHRRSARGAHPLRRFPRRFPERSAGAVGAAGRGARGARARRGEKAKELIEPMAGRRGTIRRPPARATSSGWRCTRPATGTARASCLRPFLASRRGDDVGRAARGARRRRGPARRRAGRAREYSSSSSPRARPRSSICAIVRRSWCAKAVAARSAASCGTRAQGHAGGRVSRPARGRRWRAAGDENTAKSMLDESSGARERAGLEESKREGVERELVRAVGCLLPMSGKARALGDRALRGALLAADMMAPQDPVGRCPSRSSVRDTIRIRRAPPAALEELAQGGRGRGRRPARPRRGAVGGAARRVSSACRSSSWRPTMRGAAS